MLLQFDELYQAAREGRPAAMTLEAEGTTYVRNFRSKERLILLGGGHIAQPLCRYGADLGFAVTVVDDRPSFVNRGRFPEAKEVLAEIHAPIGLPIHALTTQEIAISIAAELIQCRRRDTPRRSGGTILVTEDIDLPVLEFLAYSQEPKALLMVLETSGSTPVKSGAMMAVDRSLKTVGTIGGGCSEHAILMEAHRLIGTDQCRCIQVDMSNDVAKRKEWSAAGR